MVSEVFKKIQTNPQKWLFYLLIVAMVFITYGNTIQHDYNLDDAYYINLLPSEDGSLKEHLSVITKWFNKNNYRPVPTFHLSMEQMIFRQHPIVFHTFNLIYFAALCSLIFFLFGYAKVFKNSWALFFLVIFFIVHPAHSNVVASIKNRESILCMLYGLLGVYCFYRFFKFNNYFFLFLSLVLIVISVSCKLDGLIYAGFGGLLVYFTTENRKRLFRIIGATVLVMALGMTLFIASQGLIMESSELLSVTEFYENPMITNEFSIGQVLKNIGISHIYHRYMVIPNHYYFYYGFNQICVPKILSPQVGLMVLMYLSLLVWMIRQLIRKDTNPILFGTMTYGLFLFPYIFNMEQIAGIIAVRYTFNASLGFSILVIGLAVLINKRLKGLFRKAFGVLSLFILVGLLIATFNRNKVWENKGTLFSHDLKSLKDSYMANRMGGAYYLNLGENNSESKEDKKKYFIKSDRYLKRAARVYQNDPKLYQLMGRLQVNNENYKSAYFEFKKAIEVDSSNVESWMVYSDFCNLAKDYKRAEEGFFKALELNPKIGSALRGLSFALIDQNKIESALEVNNDFIASEVNVDIAYENIGQAYWAIGDTANTIYHFEKAFNNGLQNEPLKSMLQELKDDYNRN